MKVCAWISGVIAIGAAACASDSLDLIVSPPGEISRIALLFESESGALVGATGILPAPRGRMTRGLELELAGEVSGVTVAGFSEDDLASIALPSSEILERVPLAIAGASDPVLPAPRWIARGEITGGRARPQAISGEALELKASWLPVCPELIPRGVSAFVDVECADLRCEVRLTQSECTLSGELTPCGAPISLLELDGRGRGTAGACSTIDPPSDAALSIACGACRADVYVPADGDRFETRELRVLPDIEFGPTGLFSPLTGYLAGLAVLRDQLAVATHGGQFADPFCATRPPSAIRFFDLDTLEMTREATAAPCLMRLARDPERSELAALFTGDRFRVARFDPNGRLIDEVELESPLPATHYATALTYTADSARIAAGFGPLLPAADPRDQYGRLIAFDRRTLERGTAVDFADLVEITATKGPVVAVSVDSNSTVVFVDVASGTTPSIVHVASGRLVGKTLRYFGYLAAQDLLAGGTIGPRGSIHVLGELQGWVDAAVSYEVKADHGALVAWPHQPDRALVSLIAPDYRVYLGLFDTARVRFLPGITEVGRGIATAADTDLQGKSWIMLPWTARVIEVRPR